MINRYYSIDPELLEAVKKKAGIHKLSEDDMQRASNRIQTGESIHSAKGIKYHLANDTRKGIFGIRRKLQGGKKGQYGRLAGNLAAHASVIAGRDPDEALELSSTYGGVVRGAMALKKNLNRKGSLAERAWRGLTGKKRRNFWENLKDRDTYRKSLQEFHKGRQKSAENASKILENTDGRKTKLIQSKINNLLNS